MNSAPVSPLDASWETPPTATDLIQAAMQWHFNPETGSPFWLDRIPKLDFDPRSDIRAVADLTRFPNVVEELRDINLDDLIPRGHTASDGQPVISESGGTTGSPKRVIWTPATLEMATTWHAAGLRKHGPIRKANWLCIGPSGPHMAGTLISKTAARFGAMCLTVDMDPRWVKRLLARGASDEVNLYIEHVVDQAEWILRSQDISVLYSTPPLLDGLIQRDGIAELINEMVEVIGWGGTKMDTDVRDRYQNEIFPKVRLVGGYAGTMVHGGTVERPRRDKQSPTIFDPPAPFVMFSVVDPDTMIPVPYEERGQLLTHHISRGLFLPNNLERDTAIRLPHGLGRDGDSIADVRPVSEFKGQIVREGIY
jgi:acyl-CoA synthetase (AMP-forming)/AMP-acid ligase II